MNFYVEPAQGHDDFLMSLALIVEAAEQYSPRSARGESQLIFPLTLSGGVGHLCLYLTRLDLQL